MGVGGKAGRAWKEGGGGRRDGEEGGARRRGDKVIRPEDQMMIR